MCGRLTVRRRFQRTRLWKRLLEISNQLREIADETTKPVVFSAIRCLASLIPENEINQLIPLLEPPNPIETRLVTLQAVANIYEQNPPEDPRAVRPLADRVFELADNVLDRDWLVAGEKAAIGLNAMHALASLADERLTHCVSKVRDINADWFTYQAIKKLESTLGSWEDQQDLQTRQVAYLEAQIVQLRQ